MTDLHPLITARQSRRLIDPDKPVRRADILSLLEAARWAPSCANKQPWRLVVSMDESLSAVRAALNRGNGWAKNAPVLMALASKPELDCQLNGRDYHTLGLGLALENLLLQASHLGLVVHPMAGFDEAQVKAALQIPDDFRVYVLVAVGHPGTADHVDAETLTKEQKPRTRNPLEAWVGWDRWPEPG